MPLQGNFHFRNSLLNWKFASTCKRGETNDECLQNENRKTGIGLLNGDNSTARRCQSRQQTVISTFSPFEKQGKWLFAEKRDRRRMSAQFLWWKRVRKMKGVSCIARRGNITPIYTSGHVDQELKALIMWTVRDRSTIRKPFTVQTAISTPGLLLSHREAVMTRQRWGIDDECP